MPYKIKYGNPYQRESCVIFFNGKDIKNHYPPSPPYPQKIKITKMDKNKITVVDLLLR
jgi:hypothetical protein